MNEAPKTRRYLQSSGFANDLMIGMADGMLLPFALVAALSLMISRTGTIALAGAAEALLLALLFGVAAYRTVVNQAAEYPAGGAGRPPGLIPHLQLLEILRGLDLGPDILEKAARDGSDYQARWEALLASYDLGLPAPDYRRARRNGFFVGISFLLGALLPVLPFAFASAPAVAFRYAAVCTVAGLAAFGVAKAAYTGSSAWAGVVRLVLTGIVVILTVLVAVILIGRH